MAYGMAWLRNRGNDVRRINPGLQRHLEDLGILEDDVRPRRPQAAGGDNRERAAPRPREDLGLPREAGRHNIDGAAAAGGRLRREERLRGANVDIALLRRGRIDDEDGVRGDRERGGRGRGRGDRRGEDYEEQGGRGVRGGRGRGRRHDDADEERGVHDGGRGGRGGGGREGRRNYDDDEGREGRGGRGGRGRGGRGGGGRGGRRGDGDDDDGGAGGDRRGGRGGRGRGGRGGRGRGGRGGYQGREGNEGGFDANVNDGDDEPVRRVRLDRSQRRNFRYDFRNLSRLLASEADLVLADLGGNLDSLREVLDRQGSRQDLQVVLLSVMAKAASTEASYHTLNKVLAVVVESRFLLTAVPDLLHQAQLRATMHEVESRGTLKDIVELLTEIVIRLPQSSLVVMGAVELVRMTVDILRGRTHVVDDELLQNVNNLEQLKADMLEQLQNPNARATPRGEAGERPPPDDFREIEITPSVDDIFPKEEVYLRKNKDEGGYDDLDDYLDVQFRLLREDFISPLREGIHEYRDTRSQRRFQDIRLYDNVRIVRSVCSNTDLNHRLAFDITKFKGVRWENTKRLIYGALVCLSTDNFNTFLVATVSDREPKNLKMGLVDVQFATP